MDYIISTQHREELDAIKTVGSRVWITSWGTGAPKYMVGKRGKVIKVNRVRVMVEIDPADRRAGEPTKLSIDPASLRLSGTR